MRHQSFSALLNTVVTEARINRQVSYCSYWIFQISNLHLVVCVDVVGVG